MHPLREQKRARSRVSARIASHIRRTSCNIFAVRAAGVKSHRIYENNANFTHVQRDAEFAPYFAVLTEEKVYLVER